MHFAKFELSLSPEKTKVIEFGRFAQRSKEKRHQGKPETFHFLGFTFYCGKSRAGKFLVKVKSDRKKVAKKMKGLHSWLKEHRKMPVKELILKLNRSLKGYYQYYGVSFNCHALEYFRYEVEKVLFKWLNRRSQRKSYTWPEFNRRILEKFPIVKPKISYCLYGST